MVDVSDPELSQIYQDIRDDACATSWAVIGYTDTVGVRVGNQLLSLNRAYEIAKYFRQHGVTVPIRYTGFGEDVLAVQTPDETDEVRNRRARYVLAVENPENASWNVIK